MAVVDAPNVADTQRNRAFRKEQAGAATRATEPPRQRRSGMAALAVVLIAGGALLAGLLAVRMDAREPVLVAARDIAPGAQITSADLKEANVSSEGLPLIPADERGQILDGTVYAKYPIKADTLIDQNVLTRESPVAGNMAIVAVPLEAGLAPVSELRAGDLVEVVRTGAKSGGQATVLTEAIVLSRSSSQSSSSSSSAEAQLSQRGGSINVQVPREIAASIVDAAAGGSIGLILVERGRALSSPSLSSDTSTPSTPGTGSEGSEGSQ